MPQLASGRFCEINESWQWGTRGGAKARQPCPHTAHRKPSKRPLGHVSPSLNKHLGCARSTPSDPDVRNSPGLDCQKYARKVVRVCSKENRIITRKRCSVNRASCKRQTSVYLHIHQPNQGQPRCHQGRNNSIAATRTENCTRMLTETDPEDRASARYCILGQGPDGAENFLPNDRAKDMERNRLLPQI